MENENIVLAVAKAIYVSRKFTDVSLQKMTLTNLADEWPNSEYVNWKFLSSDEKNDLIKNAREWLILLKDCKPEHYQILINNWESIDCTDT